MDWQSRQGVNSAGRKPEYLLNVNGTIEGLDFVQIRIHINTFVKQQPYLLETMKNSFICEQEPRLWLSLRAVGPDLPLLHVFFAGRGVPQVIPDPAK